VDPAWSSEEQISGAKKKEQMHTKYEMDHEFQCEMSLLMCLSYVM